MNLQALSLCDCFRNPAAGVLVGLGGSEVYMFTRNAWGGASSVFGRSRTFSSDPTIK